MALPECSPATNASHFSCPPHYQPQMSPIVPSPIGFDRQPFPARFQASSKRFDDEVDKQKTCLPPWPEQRIGRNQYGFKCGLFLFPFEACSAWI